MMNNKIRILEVIDSGMIGGGQEHLFNLVMGLNPDQFDVSVSCPEDGPLSSRLKTEGFTISPTNFRNRFDIMNAVSLYKILKSNKIDIIHNHGSVAGAWGRIAAIFARTPVRIYTLHGIHYLNYSNLFLKHIFILMAAGK